MSPNKDETAVHGSYCRGDMAVRVCKVLAIPRSWWCVLQFRLWSYNAPCSPTSPQKQCITIVFDFSWDYCNTQERLETMVIMQLYWGEGVNKVHYGLCENDE